MDDDVTRAWLAGAQAARASDVAALRAERLRLRDEAAKARGMGLRHAAEDITARALGAGVCADIVEGMPLPDPPAPPQSPLPSPDDGTGPQGDGAPAGGRGVAEAYVEAAGVCERMAQAHDRVASAAGASSHHGEVAAELRLAADRIRRLAGGP
jgi:hypothetical protein